MPGEVSNRLSRQVIQAFETARSYQMDLQELYGVRQSVLALRHTFPTEQEALCQYFRDRMDFPISAQKARHSDKVVFEIFREKFYELGIYVFKDAFKDNSVSGLCLNDDYFPIIMINNSMSFARQNFTLFHELYHLIANTSGAEIIRDDYYIYLDEQQSHVEKACDSFANEFLVPMEDFKTELKKQPLDEMRIADLASLYAVSKEAIMYKLYTMKIITPADYNALKETFYGDAIRNQQKKPERSGGNYYYTKLSYLGSKYTGDVFSQYFSGKIDSYRASEMLHSKVDHLPKLESVYFRGVK